MQEPSEEYYLKIAKSISMTTINQDLSPLRQSELRTTRLRSTHPETTTLQTVMNQKQVIKLIELKQQLLIIRQRKKMIPRVADPEVVSQFQVMKETKHKRMVRQRVKQRVDAKKKQLTKLKHLYGIYALEFDEKNEVFKEKSALLRVLGSKMETELTKTKERYREVEFNRVIVLGLRNVLFYRLAQILFNENVRPMFNSAIPHSPQTNEDTIANCLAYLTLFISIVGNIVGARMWINFVFRGPRSTVKLSDGTVVSLHPKQQRFSQAIRVLCEQVYQLLRDKMHMKVQNTLSFYQLCEQLSKQILTMR